MRASLRLPWTTAKGVHITTILRINEACLVGAQCETIMIFCSAANLTQLKCMDSPRGVGNKMHVCGWFAAPSPAASGHVLLQLRILLERPTLMQRSGLSSMLRDQRRFLSQTGASAAV